MPNRRLRSVQPMLESMEARALLSTMQARALLNDVGTRSDRKVLAAALVRPLRDAVKHSEASQLSNQQALERLERQEYEVKVHAREHTPSALPTPAQQAASAASNLFKSLGQSL